MIQTTSKYLGRVFLLLVISPLALISCSLYKSEGRKNFESESKDVLQIQSETKPIQCDEISYLTYWYETRFPSPHSQWVEGSERLEVWQDLLDTEQVRVRTYENHQGTDQQIPTLTRCQATFASLRDWAQNRSFYLKSLEGEQL